MLPLSAAQMCYLAEAYLKRGVLVVICHWQKAPASLVMCSHPQRDHTLLYSALAAINGVRRLCDMSTYEP